MNLHTLGRILGYSILNKIVMIGKHEYCHEKTCFNGLRLDKRSNQSAQCHIRGVFDDI